MGADLVTCVLYTKAVARFPLRYLGFLVILSNCSPLLVCVCVFTSSSYILASEWQNWIVAFQVCGVPIVRSN